ncbi:hypothetical protein N7G274_001514 [Stereocaulon virgatum]|uniref:Uncharacterized protein n=1 Tax=Stereocaulon virgatum TaxID=373712 RepID=A0ABR4AMX3_9LECA
MGQLAASSQQLPAKHAYTDSYKTIATHASHHPTKTITHIQTHRLLVEGQPSLKGFIPLAEDSFSILHYDSNAVKDNKGLCSELKLIATYLPPLRETSSDILDTKICI